MTTQLFPPKNPSPVIADPLKNPNVAAASNMLPEPLSDGNPFIEGKQREDPKVPNTNQNAAYNPHTTPSFSPSSAPIYRVTNVTDDHATSELQREGSRSRQLCVQAPPWHERRRAALGRPLGRTPAWWVFERDQGSARRAVAPGEGGRRAGANVVGPVNTCGKHVA